jgi:hypothetical protein
MRLEDFVFKVGGLIILAGFGIWACTSLYALLMN